VRWHVELNEKGTPLQIEHVDDVYVARDAAAAFVRDIHGGHKSIPEPRVCAARAQGHGHGLRGRRAGQEWAYEIDAGYSVLVAALDDAGTDADCWKCAGVGELPA
jgi:hypothetical protein